MYVRSIELSRKKPFLNQKTFPMSQYIRETKTSVIVPIPGFGQYNFLFGSPSGESVEISIRNPTDFDELLDGFPGHHQVHLPVRPETMQIQLVDSTGLTRAGGNPPLVLENVTPVATDNVDHHRSWWVNISNTENKVAYVIITVVFTGWRQLLTTSYNLDLLNVKLNELFNNVQPIAVELYSKPLEFHFPGPLELPYTYIKTTVNQDWANVYPEFAIDRNIGLVGFIKRPLKTSRIFLSASVVENRPAITVRVSLSDWAFDIANLIKSQVPESIDEIDGSKADIVVGATIGALVGGVPGAALGGMIGGFVGSTETGNSIGRALIRTVANYAIDNIVPVIEVPPSVMDISLVLRTDVRTRANELLPTFDIRVNQISGGSNSQLVSLAVQFLLSEFLKNNEFAISVQKYARVLLAFITGDPDTHVINIISSVSLSYAKPDSQLVVFPTTPPKPLEQGNLKKIKHIVVLMMENRSFDHMLGYLSLPVNGNNGRVGRGRHDVNGLTGNESNVINLMSPDTTTVFPFPGTDYDYDLGHGESNHHLQRGSFKKNVAGRLVPIAANGGFILDYDEYLKHKNYPGVTDEKRHDLRKESMGYHPRHHVPIYDFVAENFAICDKWYAAVPLNTWPNRYVALTGKLNTTPSGEAEKGIPDFDSFVPSHNTTIFDHLTAKNIPWRYYESNIGTLRLFAKYTQDIELIRSFNPAPSLGHKGFIEELKELGRANTLPSVIYVDPSMVDLSPIEANDDHPPTDIKYGQAFVKKILETLRSLPQWNDILFIITYDEHGGFYDHVFPQADTAAPLFNDINNQPVTHRGFRVPSFVISPWVPKSFVSHEVFDHTSILKTIMARFLNTAPPDLGPRVAAANDLGSILTEGRPRETPARFPDVLLPQPRRAVPGIHDQLHDKEDFRAFLFHFKNKFLANHGIDIR
jgi:phospholipase C